MERVIGEIKEKIEEYGDDSYERIIAVLEDISDYVAEGYYDRGFVREWHKFLIELGMCIPAHQVLYSDVHDTFMYKGEKYMCIESFSSLSEEKLSWILLQLS